MHRSPTKHLRRVAVPLLCALALTTAGCVPGFAWLPDSSGLIFSAGERGQKLVHYDLARNRRHVLVEDTGAETNWPAVSPDGRQIAVAKLLLKKGEKKTNLQVLLYSRAGKLLKRSKVFDWAESDKPAPSDANNDRTAWPQLFWGPKDDKIIVHAVGYTAIYDAQADRLIHAGQGWLLAFGGTPVRPDGAGFLIIKNWQRWLKSGDGKNQQGVDPEFTFVDWRGKVQPLKAPGLFLDPAALKKEKDENKLMALLCPALYESGWRGDVASVSWNEDRLSYLTGKGQAVLERIKPDRTADGLLIMRRHQFPGRQSRVRVVVAAKNIQQSRPLRVEILKPGQQEPQILLDQVQNCVLIPAPNGKLLAVRTLASGNKSRGEVIVVVNATGDVVARIPVDG